MEQDNPEAQDKLLAAKQAILDAIKETAKVRMQDPYHDNPQGILWPNAKAVERLAQAYAALNAEASDAS